MSHRFRRVVAWLGAGAACLLMAGCGATENGSVIAVPPAAVATAAPAASNGAVSGFQERLSSQLTQAAQTGAAAAPHVKKVHTRLPPIRHHVPR